MLRQQQESESDSSLSRDSPPRTDDPRGPSTSDHQAVSVANGHLVANDLDSSKRGADAVDSARVSDSAKVTSRTSNTPQPQAGTSDLATNGPRSPNEAVENGVGDSAAEELKLNLQKEERLSEVTSPDTPAKVLIPKRYFVQ